MLGSPLHWVFFLYFTVHAHEDRHGTGVIYQLGEMVDLLAVEIEKINN